MSGFAEKKVDLPAERQKKPGRFEKPRVDYFVYGYVYPDAYTDRQRNWVKILKTGSRRRALNKAKKLHENRAYRKIEIKKNVFDSCNKKSSSAVLKTYQHMPDRNIDLAPFMFLALMCCIFAFLAGHYIWL